MEHCTGLGRLVLRSPAVLTNESTSSDCPSFLTSPHRVKIAYQDERLCRRQQANVVRLLEAVQTSISGPSTIMPTSPENDEACTAATPPSSSSSSHSPTSVLLAKKALRYRKMLDRAQQVDLKDPAFDVGLFLGVEWCKVERNRSSQEDAERSCESRDMVVNLCSE